MMRNIFWFIMICIAIAYAVIVYSWMTAGNDNHSTTKDCADFMTYSNDQIDRIPDSCLRPYIENQPK